MTITDTTAGPLAATTATTLTPTYPAGLAVDDVLVAHVVTWSGTITVPAGWTKVSQNTAVGIREGIYLRVHAGEAPQQWGFDQTSGSYITVSKRRGVDTATPIDVAAPAPATANSTAMTAPSITTVTDGAQVEHFWTVANDRDSSGPSAGTLATYVGTDYDSPLGNQGGMAGTYRSPAAAGASGTAGLNINTATTWIGHTLAFRPATTGPLPPAVNAGADVTDHPVSTEFTRTATEDDGGDPITSRAWTIVSGPAGAGTTIGTAAALVWTPGTAGTYVLRYSATNSGGTGIDELTIDVVDPNAPLWSADNESGLVADYYDTDNPGDYADPNESVIVDAPTHPARSGTRSLRSTINGTSTSGQQRAERVPGGVPNFVEGQERWFGWSLWLADGFPTQDSWQVLAQWHSENHDTPPFELDVGGGRLELTGGDTTVPMTPQDLGPATTGVWIDMLARVVFSSDPAIGVVDWWRDGVQLLTGFKPPGGTLYPGFTSYLKFGIYRNPALTTFPATVYQDEWSIGTTRQSVELTPLTAAVLVEGARASTAASRPVLTQSTELVVTGVSASTRAAAAALAQRSALLVPAVRADPRTPVVALTQTQPLTVRPARSAARVGSPNLAASGTLQVRPARSAATAGMPLLTQHTALTVRRARAETRARRPLVVHVVAVTVLSGRAESRAGLVAVDQHTLLLVSGARAPTRARRVPMPGAYQPVPPPERTLAVASEPRLLAVAADDRTLTVPAEIRTLTV